MIWYGMICCDMIYDMSTNMMI